MTWPPSWHVRMACLLLVVVAVGGCGATLTRNAVPLELADKVEVAGMPEVRHWGDAPVPNLAKAGKLRVQQIKATRPQFYKNIKRPVSLLAISGGGADGAFGAGLLNGWTASGKRPVFEIVTGVSAGALSAPFAFLGPDYDDELKEVFTNYTTKDLLTPQLLAGLTGGSAVSSSKPLADLITRYMSREVIGKIAAQHRRGRRLFIGTTNLDSERPVVWDMGAIANIGTKESRHLFRRILLASASIPGAFPPVFVRVESGGKTYDEMHVDGGTTENAFLLPPGFDARKNLPKSLLKRKIRLYIIANSKTTPDAEIVKANTFAIAGRSISTLIKQQLEGDLLKIYLRAKKNNFHFLLATIPPDFNEVSKEVFDRPYMRKLFEVGYKVGQDDKSWSRRPPGI
ncbi:MAG: patatin-like phospholipase family protein [Filomicrobium sp.]